MAIIASKQRTCTLTSSGTDTNTTMRFDLTFYVIEIMKMGLKDGETKRPTFPSFVKFERSHWLLMHSILILNSLCTIIRSFIPRKI